MKEITKMSDIEFDTHNELDQKIKEMFEKISDNKITKEEKQEWIDTLLFMSISQKERICTILNNLYL